MYNKFHSDVITIIKTRWVDGTPTSEVTRSLSGRSLNLTLVTKWSRSHLTLKIHMSRSWPRSNPLVTFKGWSWIDMFAFYFMGIEPFWVEIQQIRYFTLKHQGQGHGQSQIWWSHLRPRAQSICLLFVSWQSDHFWQRYSKFHIWPWKFKVKVMSKVKPDGHNWRLEINWYICFSFRGNLTIFDWDIANSIIDLENSRSRSWPRSNLMVTFEA